MCIRDRLRDVLGKWSVNGNWPCRTGKLNIKIFFHVGGVPFHSTPSIKTLPFYMFMLTILILNFKACLLNFIYKRTQFFVHIIYSLFWQVDGKIMNTFCCCYYFYLLICGICHINFIVMFM